MVEPKGSDGNVSGTGDRRNAGDLGEFRANLRWCVQELKLPLQTLILLGTFHWHTVCDIAVAIRSLASTGDASDLSTQLAMRKLLEGFREANLVHQA